MGVGMKRFVEGKDRRQTTLLPDCIDDYVSEDNPVRVFDIFVDDLDLAALHFAGMMPAVTGRPAYHPSTLLKIYLYGYLNQIQSSRRLEREAQRNIELMWLVKPTTMCRCLSIRRVGAGAAKHRSAFLRLVPTSEPSWCRHLERGRKPLG